MSQTMCNFDDIKSFRLKLSIFDIFQYCKVDYDTLSATLMTAIVLGLNIQSLIFFNEIKTISAKLSAILMISIVLDW